MRRVLSVRSDGPCLAPFVEIGASPRNRTRPEAHWARELVLSDQPVDGRPPESGHAHDGGHPQEERRHHLSAAGRWYGRIAVHGLSPERGISATLGCKLDWRRAGFGSNSCRLPGEQPAPRRRQLDPSRRRCNGLVTRVRMAWNGMGHYGNSCGNGLTHARRTATVRQRSRPRKQKSQRALTC